MAHPLETFVRTNEAWLHEAIDALVSIESPTSDKAAVDRAGQYAYRDRRTKKRNFRALWIQRINAAARLEGFTYSQFIHGLNLAGIELDRKVMAAIAADETGFKAIADKVRDALK